MAGKAQSTFSQLPMWAKGTIAVVGVLSLVGIAIWIRKGIKNLSENMGERQEEKDIISNAQQQLNQLQQQGVQTTLSDLDTQTLANTIQTLLEGCELSGSEKIVVDSILQKVNNQADWVKLQQVFGRRKIDNCGYWTGDTDYDLKGLLTDQLDNLDWSFNFYSTVLKKGLEKKGITF
jgi:hypothetical protein